jgi:hypothetical protein
MVVVVGSVVGSVVVGVVVVVSAVVVVVVVVVAVVGGGVVGEVVGEVPGPPGVVPRCAQSCRGRARDRGDGWGGSAWVGGGGDAPLPGARRRGGSLPVGPAVVVDPAGSVVTVVAGVDPVADTVVAIKTSAATSACVPGSHDRGSFDSLCRASRIRDALH